MQVIEGNTKRRALVKQVQSRDFVARKHKEGMHTGSVHFAKNKKFRNPFSC